MTERKQDRRVTVSVGGTELHMNGFVQDLFQEIVVALVRSLGGSDERQAIEVTVAAAPEHGDGRDS